MTFVSKKRINGINQFYLEKSIRLLNGRVKKFSVYIKNYEPKKEFVDINSYKEKLQKKIIKELKKIASEYYKKNYIYNKRLIEQLEETKLGYRDIIKKLTKKQLQDIIDRFTVNFTYESNAIEGNSLTIKDVTMILNENKVISGKDLREIYETLNTREALKLIFNNKLKINERDIINLHKILIKNTGVNVGYKRLPNFLLGRKIKTAPPEKVEEEINHLIEWYYDSKNMHPLQKATIFHGKFEKIHPFEDGNGRVGRLLINIILLNNGYAPLIIRKSHRIAYFNALEAFDDGYFDKLHRFLIEKYKNTYKNFFGVYIKYLKGE